MIVEVGNVLVQSEILTELFCCDLTECRGICCVEGDAGAPVTIEEVAELETAAELVWDALSAQAQACIDKQGVVYTDRDGDLVTSIINGRDCVFTCYKDLTIDGQTVPRCCLCAIDSAYREGRAAWQKPISCALYPIREKQFRNGFVGLEYNRWDICHSARKKGVALGVRVYEFLREPLIRRFGEEWYKELALVAKEFNAQSIG